MEDGRCRHSRRPDFRLPRRRPYRLGIEYGTDTARWIYARIRETPWLVAPWAVAAIAAALAIAWMVKKEPMAGGSGIPQTNGVVISAA